MTKYVLYRVIGALSSIWLAVTLTFFAIQLVPGDPVQAALSQSTATQDVLEQRRAQLGLDRPVLVQYGSYILGIAHADFGVSWSAGQPVAFLIGQQLRPTVSLALAGTLIAFGTGMALGLAASIGQEGFLGDLARSAAGILLSFPVMFSGMLVIGAFAVQVHLFPATGQGTLRHLVLPAVVVGLSGSGSIARTVEAGIADMLDEPFIKMAIAKGLRRTQVLVRHALRVGLLPTLDALALQVGFLLGGAVITEAVFARQGVGRLLLQAVLDKDLPLVQAIVILSVLVYAILNLFADVVHAILDPRLRGTISGQ